MGLSTSHKASVGPTIIAFPYHFSIAWSVGLCFCKSQSLKSPLQFSLIYSEVLTSVVVVVRSEQDKEPEPEVASETVGPGPSDDSAGDGI